MACRRSAVRSARLHALHLPNIQHKNVSHPSVSLTDARYREAFTCAAHLKAGFALTKIFSPCHLDDRGSNSTYLPTMTEAKEIRSNAAEVLTAGTIAHQQARVRRRRAGRGILKESDVPKGSFYYLLSVQRTAFWSGAIA